MWRARSEQLHAGLLQGLLHDRETWQPTELSLDTLCALELTRARQGYLLGCELSPPEPRRFALQPCSRSARASAFLRLASACARSRGTRV